MKEEGKGIMEITINSPKHVRRNHKWRRAKWIKECRERDKREVHKIRVKKEYHKRKICGMCVSAGCNNKAESGRVLCKKHIKERVEYDWIKGQKRKQEREMKKLMGLCTESGCEERPEEGGTLCKKHKERKKKSNERYKELRRRRYHKKKKMQICVKEGCENKISGKHVMCEKHLKERRVKA